MNGDGIRVFVTAGTDHHPFDRLMDWIGAWSTEHDEAHVVVQHGASHPPAGVEAHDLLTADEMVTQLEAADVVVVSAGPGAVMAARAAGRRPIAVPRRKGEAVDDHQLAFAELMEREGVAWCATSGQALTRLLDTALDEPGTFRCDPSSVSAPAASRVFARLVDQLVRDGTTP